MRNTKHAKTGKRLITAMREVVDHVEGRMALPTRYVEVPEDVDVRAIRSKLGLSQTEFSRRYAVSPRSLQEWEQGRRRPESAVRAYLTVIDRNPQAVENALMNKSVGSTVVLPLVRSKHPGKLHFTNTDIENQLK